MAIIAGEVFTAFQKAGVDDDTAKKAAAEVGELHELTRTIRQDLAEIKTALTYMRWTLGITATGSLATAAGVFALVYKAVVV